MVDWLMKWWVRRPQPHKVVGMVELNLLTLRRQGWEQAIKAVDATLASLRDQLLRKLEDKW